MYDLQRELEKKVRGDVHTDAETLEMHSKDTSLFKVLPKVVVFPSDSEDVKEVVRFVKENKASYPELSITGRSAGTDMAGGPLNESIILGFTPHFTLCDVDEDVMEASVGPGVFYRDFEKEILPEHLSLPVYPASKNIAALGGMIMNNCGGEKSLRYGQMRDFIKELRMVLSDGNEYSFKKLGRSELEEKKNQTNFEGSLYRQMESLVLDNQDVIQSAKPKVSKNSSGYALWNVYDRENDTFDLTQIFVGSQGTLGMLAEARVRLVKEKPHKRLIPLFFKDWSELPAVVSTLLPYEPMSLETFDDETLKLGIRFMPEIAKKVGESFISFAMQFVSEFSIGVRMLGIPKLVILVELEENSVQELNTKTESILEALSGFKVWTRVLKEKKEMNAYWTMRHESFNLLRQHVKGKSTAPFIEDFCVAPKYIPQFLPSALALLKEYEISVNIAGHAGNGNFHIIPLMDLSKESERDKIVDVADKFYELVLEYEGTITAEHNDGIMRTPYVKDMFGDGMYALFEEVKQIFDPQNIFNPGKKVG